MSTYSFSVFLCIFRDKGSIMTVSLHGKLFELLSNMELSKEHLSLQTKNIRPNGFK
jgi:hypothetical protein